MSYGARFVVTTILMVAPPVGYPQPHWVAAQEPSGDAPCVTWTEHRTQVNARRAERGDSPAPDPRYTTGMYISVSMSVPAGASPNPEDLLRGARVLIETVICGGAADRGGLRRGDQILTINDRPFSAPGALPGVQFPRREGETFRVQVLRGQDTVAVTLVSARPPRPAGGRGG